MRGPLELSPSWPSAWGSGSARFKDARSSESVTNARVIAAYRSQIRSGRHSETHPNAVVAGDTDFVDFSAIFNDLRPLYGWTVFNSPSVTDAQMDERVALNDLLMGFDRSSFEARQQSYFKGHHAGPLERNRSLVPASLAARLAAYDYVDANLSAALDRFAVRYVGLPAGTQPLYLRQGWALVSGGPTWDVWEQITISDPGPLMQTHRL